jgi:predicted nucleotidyltransferase
MTIGPRKTLSSIDKEIIIQEVKKFLHSQEGVRFALLYGSLADPGDGGRYGDMDIALFMNPGFLTAAEYRLEADMEAKIHGVLSSRGLPFPPLEILIVNNAPNHFLVKMLKGPYLILKGEEGEITDFIEAVGAKSTANFHFRMGSLKEVAEG